MKRSVLGVAAGLALMAATANAQSMAPVAKPVSFGIAGGLSMPTGDFGDAVNTGYNISGLVQYKGPMWPVALRLEAQWQHFGIDSDVIDAGVRSLGALANVLYYIPSAGMVKPYLTGGLGLLNFKVDDDACPADADCSSTKFGFDFGAGLEFQLSGMSTFVEANWQSIQTEGSATRMFPIRFGIKF